MKHVAFIEWKKAFLSFIFMPAVLASFAGRPPGLIKPPTLPENPGKKPVLFLENRGQIRDDQDRAMPTALFESRGDYAKVVITKSGIIYQFEKFDIPQNMKAGSIEPGSVKGQRHRMDMVLVNANPEPKVNREIENPYFENYYNLPAFPQGISGVRSWEKLTLSQVWPGVDWVVYSKGEGIKYDFILKPGADLGQIQMRYDWADAVVLNEDGSLTLQSRLGNIVEDAPVFYQNGRSLRGHFVLNAKTISFSVEGYNPQLPLVIDPSISWSTYYGGSSTDYGYGTCTDAAGNVYLSGSTYSNSGIATGGGYDNNYSNQDDAFLVKFNAAGVRQWGTYFGGSNSDYATSVCTDASGNIFLSGTTSSNGLGYLGHQNNKDNNSDAFLVKFSSAGARTWATYYGGSSTDNSRGVATDAAGNVYLSGSTSSDNGIASGGHQNSRGGNSDAFLVKFNTSGVRQWGTYYGGGQNETGPAGVSVDHAGNPYLFGNTQSTTGIASGGHDNSFNGDYDAYVAKFNTAGTRQWATYYGGSLNDEAHGLAFDASDNLFLAGLTVSNTGIASSGYDNTHNGGNDGMLVKFNSSGTRIWGTYFGGSGTESFWGLGTNSTNQVIVMGEATSSGLASGGFQNSSGGGQDLIIAKFDNSGTLAWSTYFGGSGTESCDGPMVAISGNYIYIPGSTNSSGGISAGSPHQASYGGNTDAFLLRIYDPVCTMPDVPTLTINQNPICEGQSVLVSITGGSLNDAVYWNWYGGSCGGDSIGAGTSFSLSPTRDTVLYVRGEGGCANPPGACQSVSITVNHPDIEVRGNHVVIADGDITPSVSDSTDFGDVPMGQPVEHIFWIYNRGCSQIILNGLISFSGTGATSYSITQAPATTIWGGDSTSFRVRFSNAGAGTFDATLSISSNDPDESSYDFALTAGSRDAGRVLDFDGNNDYVRLHENTPGTEFGGAGWTEATLETWVMITGQQGNPQAFISSIGNEFIHMQARSNNPGWNNVVFTNAGAILLPVFPTNLSGWHHYALVAKSGDSRVYIDGVLQGAADPTTFSYITTATGGVFLGQGFGGGRNLHGEMDEVQIWKRAFTQTEIQNRMNCALHGTETGLAAYLKLDAGYADGNNAGLTTAPDNGPLNHYGTLNNFALSGNSSNWTAPGAGAFANICPGAGEISVYGNHVLINSGDYSPSVSDSTSFGTTATGTSVIHRFSIRNTGPDSLLLLSLSFPASGAFAATGALPGAVAPGDSAIIYVAFQPVSCGTFTDTLTLANNDADENPYRFALSGTATDGTPPVAACVGLPANTAIFNGSFESGNFNGWTKADVSNPNCSAWAVSASANCGGPVANPTDGSKLAMNGFDGQGPGSFTLYQDVLIPVNATLSWDDYLMANLNPGAQPRTYTVSLRNPLNNALITTLYTHSITGGTSYNSGMQSHAISVSAWSGQTLRLYFELSVPEAYTGAGMYALDNVRMFGTALPSVYLNALGQAAWSASLINNGSSDNCGIASMAISPASASCANVGVFSATLTVTDNAALSSTCSSVIIVKDTLRPTAICRNLTVYPGSASPVTITTAMVNNGSSDNCASGLTYSLNCGVFPIAPQVPPPSCTFSCSDAGTVNTLTLTVSDTYGNTASCSSTITVQDTARPVALCHNVTVNLDAAGSGSVSTAQLDAGSTDNCGISSRFLDCGSPLNGVVPTSCNYTCTDAGTSRTVTLYLSDAAGNTSSCSASVSVRDNIAPVANCQNKTVYLDGAGTATVNASDINNGSYDECLPVSLSMNCTPSPLPPNGSMPVAPVVTSCNYSCSDIGSVHTVNLIVADPSLNYSQCNAYITVRDTTKPSITCYGYIRFNIPGQCSTLLNYPIPVGNDNCAGTLGPVTLVSGPARGTVQPVGDYTIVYSVTDAAGNSATCSAQVRVRDGDDPFLNCPASFSVNASNGVCNAIVNYAAVTATDNCAVQSVTRTSGLASGSVFPVGVNIVQYRADDVNGHFSTCQFSITVVDNQNPVVTCPASRNIILPPSQCDSLLAYTTPTASDNCSISSFGRTSGLASGSRFPIGVNTVLYLATDPAGNSGTCSFNLTVQDTTRPVITCPAPQTVPLGPGRCDSLLSYTPPVATDNCGTPQVVQTAGFPSSYPYPVGISQNIFRATDASGNTATCSFFMTVVHTQPPAIACPANVTAYTALGRCDQNVSYPSPTANDNCYVQAIVRTAGPASGGVFNLGNTTVSFLAQDGAGNNSTCSFQVTVLDAESPTAVCPSTVNVNTTLNTCTAVVNYPTPVAMDNCTTATVSLLSGPSQGSIFPSGNTTVSWRATDMAGNTGSCSFIVSVHDSQPPVITCPATVTQSAAGGQCAANVTYPTALASDNCTSPTVSLYAGTVSGGSFPFGNNTVVWKATDVAGNTSTCSFLVVVNDIVPPVAHCRNATVVVDSLGSGVLLASQVNNASTDNCVIQSYGLSRSAYSCQDTGVLQPVVLTVTDGSGNTSTCSAQVTVTHLGGPTAVCRNITVYLNAAGTVSVTPAQVNNSSTDPCGISTATLSRSNFGCVDMGTNLVTLNLQDNLGNHSSCSAIITVYDSIRPVAHCRNATVYLNNSGFVNVQASLLDNNSTDICGIQTWTAIPPSFSCANLGQNPIVLRVTDINTNSATCAATVTVADNTPPTLQCQNQTVSLGSNGSVSVSPAASSSFSFDNCGNISLALSQTVFTCANAGTNAVTLTATDGSGNATTCITQITVNDPVVPTALCRNNTIYLNGAGIASISAAQVNNGSSDICALSLSLNHTSFSCQQTGLNPVVLTVTDVSGQSASCQASVTVRDTVRPVARCRNATVNLGWNGSASLLTTQVDSSSSDNCSIAQYSLSRTTFTCADAGLVSVTLSVTDPGGNTSSCASMVRVQDTQAPVAICRNLSLSLNQTGTASLSPYQIDNGSTDNCYIVTRSLSQGIFTCANLGNTTVTLTIRDNSGNTGTCTSTVTLYDVLPPSVTCRNITANLNANGSASFTLNDLMQSSGDNCGSPQVSMSATSFNCQQRGYQSVSLIATDASGNTAFCTSQVFVQDVQPPSILCPSNIQVAAVSSTCSANVNWLPAQVSDNCSQVNLYSSHIPGSTFPMGNTTLSYSATDGAGNLSTCSFTVTVYPSQLSLHLVPFVFECGDNVSCTGAGDGQIQAQVRGGCQPYSYLWNTGDTLANLSGLSAGTYSVTLTDANGATAHASITLTDPDPISLNLVSSDFNGFGVTCNGSSDGYVSAFGSGGADCYPYNYTWIMPGGDSVFNSQLNNLGMGTYLLSVSDHNGCTSSTSLNITQPDSLQITALITPASCVIAGTGAIDVTVYGGAQPFSYLWADGHSTEDRVGLHPGNFFVAVTDNNGCQAGAPFVVPGGSIASGFLHVAPHGTLCIDDSVHLTADPGFVSYNWNTGSTTAETWLHYAGGWVTLAVTDTFGCSGIDSVEVVFVNGLNPHPSITPDPAAFCRYSEIILDGGAGYSAYLWNTGDTTRQHATSSPGVFFVTVTDTNGCQGTDTIDVIQYPHVNIPTITQNGNVLTSSPAAAYQWLLGSTPLPNATSQSYTVLATGTYYVMITDSNGCTALSDSFYVNVVGSAGSPDAHIELWPNPNDGRFELRAFGAQSFIVSFDLIDMDGRTLLQYRDTDIVPGIALDLSGKVAKGVYFLRAETPQGRMLFKVVVR